MKTTEKRLKPKKFTGNLMRICITCGSEKISHIDFTIYCKNCGALNFYEVAHYG